MVFTSLPRRSYTVIVCRYIMFWANTSPVCVATTDFGEMEPRITARRRSRSVSEAATTGDGEGAAVVAGLEVGVGAGSAEIDGAAVGSPDEVSLAATAVPARDTGTAVVIATTPMTTARVDVRTDRREAGMRGESWLLRGSLGWSTAGQDPSRGRVPGPSAIGTIRVPVVMGARARGGTSRPYHPGVSDLPPTLANFPSLDQAESALDWIGVDFADGDGCFEGELAASDAELLDAVLADPETPEPIRALAALMRDLLAAAGDDPTDPGALEWRVAFTA